MSWLSPKRRRTTGNLKSVPNSQISNVGSRDSTSAGSGSPPRVRTPASDRQRNTARPLSQPVPEEHAIAASDGKLFYAYARRGDDLSSRYLLTFASASIANEWWLLVQGHFPEATRPGPQLFAFCDPELLSKTWKHERFSHLKSKWMYISFTDTLPNGLGGAAQGTIPVQDADGNILGGGTPASSEVLGKMGEVKQEANGVRHEITRLEKYFEKLIEASERNTDQVAALAAVRAETVNGNGSAGHNGHRDGYFDTMTEMKSHISTVNELLRKNNEHVQSIAKRQVENDQKLRSTLQEMNSRQRNDYLDMSQLSSHLDRIQSMIESNVSDRRDSIKELTKAKQPQAIDFSPLTDRLERVQDAIEQNSALIKALLEEGTAPESKAGTPFWGRDIAQPQAIDFSPLTEHLATVREAIEHQSSHVQALVGFARGDSNDNGEKTVAAGGGDSAENFLAPLSEHLEQIYAALEEGNKHVHDIGRRVEEYADVQPLELILNEQKATHETIESADPRPNVDALGEKLDTVVEHLEGLREWSEFQSEHVKELLDLHVSDEGRQMFLTGGVLDFSSVNERLEMLVEAIDKQPTLDLTPLEKHLEGIHAATQENAAAMKAFAEAGQKHSAPNEIDFSPVTDRLSRIQSTLEKSHAQDLERDQSPSLGNAKFLMSALTSHLSKIQAVTEQNATAVKALREKHAGSQDKMQIAVAETADQLRALLQRTFTQELNESEYKKKNDLRVDAVHSQVRELMGGQREMVDVMRELARSIAAQNKSACQHVVVPPPRKMGRKIVGFVYDAKEGSA